MRLILVTLLLVAANLLPARADPAFWVARSSSATVYLFGTIHVLPAGTAWLRAPVLQALGQSREVWTEADISNLTESVSAIRHYGMGAKTSTEALLPAAYRERFRRQAAASGLPALLFSQVRPWLAEILLSAADMQRAGATAVGAEGRCWRMPARTTWPHPRSRRWTSSSPCWRTCRRRRRSPRWSSR